MFCRSGYGFLFLIMNVIGTSYAIFLHAPQDDITKINPKTYCLLQTYTRICGNKTSTRSYYYDIQRQECVLTDYGNCQHAYNNFATRDTCKTSCNKNIISPEAYNLTANIFCRFQPDFGNCFRYEPSFYFDINTGSCKGFSYSGCGGNKNRFPSATVCVAKCVPFVKHVPKD